MSFCSVFFWFYKQTNQKFLIIIQISSEWEKQQNQWQISTNQVIQIRKFEFDKIIIFSVGFFSNEKIEIKNSKFSIPNQWMNEWKNILIANQSSQLISSSFFFMCVCVIHPNISPKNKKKKLHYFLPAFYIKQQQQPKILISHGIVWEKKYL